jgi:hypothetical protein
VCQSMTAAKKSRGAATDDTISWVQLLGAAITNLQARVWQGKNAGSELAHKLLYRLVVCYCLVAARGAIDEI